MVSFEVTSFEAEHLADAARLVAARYRRLLEQTPVLPARYAEPDVLIPLLREIQEAGSGAVALDEGELKGFLAAWLIPSFRGRRTAFSPEWAHAVAPSGGRRAYEAVYTHLAAAWSTDHYVTHLVGFFPTDRVAIDCWQWLGFGMIAVDAVRGLRPVPARQGEADIRLAGPEEIDSVVALSDALYRHTASSPTFVVGDDEPQRAHYREWLQDPRRAIWLAHQGTRAVALLKIGPANDDACTIIGDEGTASITAAFAAQDIRGKGITTGLLNRSLDWARAHGYTRCAVDFEPMNHWARRFWLQHFEPVCYTFIRHIA